MTVRTDERQYRAMLELRAGVLFEQGTKRFPDSDFEVQGYFTTWNKPYALWGEYQEEVDRHALDEADMSDVIMQYDHAGKVLARLTNATLIIDLSNEHGPFMAADLSKSKAARELYEEIQAGLITRMSWAFTVLVESFNTDTNTWSIVKVKKVFDVSAVSIPANDATEISARARVDGAIDLARRSDLARKVQVLKLLTRL